MTPYEINLLIHLYVSLAPPEETPITEGTLSKFMDLGLIGESPSGQSYYVTSKGAAHIRQICELPFPKQAWIGAVGEIIDLE